MALNRLMGILGTFAPEVGLLLLFAVAGFWNMTLLEMTSVREVLLIKAAQAGLVSPAVEPELLNCPLFLWILRFFQQGFGTGLVVERAVSLLSALFALSAVYTLAMVMLKNRMSALMVAVVLATCAGFSNAAVLQGPDMLFLGFMAFSLSSFRLWLDTATVVRPVKWLGKQHVLILGALLALVMLSGGIQGLLIVLVVMAAWLVMENQTPLLRKLPWRFLLLPLLGIAMPWFLLMGMRLGIDVLWQGFMATLVLPSMFLRLEGYANTLFNGTWPYLLFMLAALVDTRSKRQRAGGYSTVLSPSALAGVWVFTMLVLGYGFHPLIVLLPPLALVTGPYLADILEGKTGYRFAGLAVDLSVMMLMLQAVATSILFFQELTDAYPVALWQFPGPALVSEVFGIELFATFAIWKLWLLPLPLVLLAAGAVMFLMALGRRTQNAPLVLILVAVLSMVYMRVFYWPIMQRVVVVTMDETIKKQSVDIDRLLVDASRPELLKVIPPEQKYLPENIGLFASAEGLAGFLEEDQSPARDTKTMWGIAREKNYYELPIEKRLQTQVMAARTEWHGFDVPSVTGWGLFFRRTPETIVLFRVLPHSLRDSESTED